MRLKFIFTFAVLGTMMFSYVGAQQTAKITSSNTAYLQYLPNGYNNNSNDYPVVISLHGIKEKGTTSTDPDDLLASVQRVANVGLPKNVKYGADYPFILISPQLKTSYGSWPAAYVLDVINHVKRTLRVDPKRVYITGFSLGGYGVWTTLGTYPEVFAAAVPICAGGNALSKACDIAAENVPVWGFHGDSDAIVSYTVTTKMVNAINACTPKPTPLAKATLFAGMGHIIWDKVYKETNALAWMLSYTNGSLSSANLPPLVDAGVDVVEYLPTNEVICTGSASDPDGAISAYAWNQVSGPSTATLTNKTTKSLKASALKAGTYTFRLKVTDDDGASADDDVKVVVSSTTNALPVVSAGSDKTITLPTNSLYIQSTASDSDGSIASYQWTKISGGTASLGGQTTSKVHAYNLVAGTYTFRVTVKDNLGAIKYDEVKVTVLSNNNVAPVAYAGTDKFLTLPTNSAKLYGSGKDSDGTIVSYKWTQYSGPSPAVISYSTTATATVSGLIAGYYYFKLTVTDDDGSIHSDKVLVRVSSGTISMNIIENTSFDSMLAVR